MRFFRVKSMRRPNRRSAFTLVEMLVSVALVMLMMTMFASIFQMATNSVSKQRIIAETDQRSRALTTVLRADFAKRSNRQSFPFFPGETPASSIVPFGARTGYVYISCNDPSSGQDDLIQFTVDARQLQASTDDSKFYGATKLLYDRIAEFNGEPTITSLRFNPNQPEADDSDLVPNGTSSSSAAEISIFVRGGNLIRRVMLLREPLPVAGEDLEIQPESTSPGHQYFLTAAQMAAAGIALPANGGGFVYIGDPNQINDPSISPPPAQWGSMVSDDFWRPFDFSAVPVNVSATPNGVTVIGIDALSNDGSVAALGNPFFRFGFNRVTGLSREHESAAIGTKFLGRYLHAETSDDDFNWPIAPSLIGNPMDVTNGVSVDPFSGLVTAFQGPDGRGGERRVEDVLLANVREFRVELWDSRLERWVTPGHDMVRSYAGELVAGDYHISRNGQQYDDGGTAKITYGPLQVSPTLLGTPHVFDTWHPQVVRDFDIDSLDEIQEHQAPFYPLKYYPPRQSDSPPGPSSDFMQDPASEYDPVANRLNANRGYWNPDTTYSVGDIVFARKKTTIPGWNDNAAAPNSAFEWLADADAIPRQSLHIAYRCVGTLSGPPTTSGLSGSPVQIPSWQSPGLRFSDNELFWEGFNNFQPLKSVRLTIRFIEPNSEQPKQLTLIMPMTDDMR